MEEPELRVGGWEKEKGRRTFRRLFNLILILGIAFAFIGPSVINYNPAYVPSESLYLANGMWNGPFDVQYSKQFSGHIKVSSATSELLEKGYTLNDFVWNTVLFCYFNLRTRKFEIKCFSYLFFALWYSFN